jgi:dihydroorotase
MPKGEIGLKRGSLFVAGGRIIDPMAGVDLVGDLLIRQGRVEWFGPAGLEACPDGCPLLPAAGLVVSPGFIDLHCHLREPGFEEKETIATGTEAAARGGFTAVCCMPNTSPAIDSPATMAYVADRVRAGARVRVFPVGCVSEGRRGARLTDMAALAEAGVVGFSDDGSPVADAGLMRRALEAGRLLDLPVMDHCEDVSLTSGGVMNDGAASARLGLRGMPAAAEESMVQRDIDLAKLTGARVHIAHVSTAGSVDIIRRGREAGARVTAEATPHHLTLTEESVGRCGASAKVNPPLRTAADVAALVEGLRDGVIDAVATDHAPHTLKDKEGGLGSAAFGISGLETALPVLLALVREGRLGLATLITRLTGGPAMVLKRGSVPAGLGGLRAGSPGDLVVFDPDFGWVVDPSRFASKGRNTPWAGRPLRGKVMATVVGGEVVYRDSSSAQERSG